MAIPYPTRDRSWLTATQRYWRDMRIWRLGVGLLLAPAIPFVLGCVVGEMLTNGLVLHEMAGFVGVLFALAMAWSIIAGLAYFLTVVRRRGRTGRMECLMFGTAAAFTLPFAVVVPLSLAPLSLVTYLHLGSPGPLSDVLPYCSGFGLFFTPFGLFGGWILWNVAVRPAPLPLPDVSSVFE